LNNTLQRASEQIRQKNLFIILIRPSFFDFSKYFAIHRSWFLLTVGIKYDEKNKRIQRGYYRFYSRSRKKGLYLRGKKTLDRFVVKENFGGRFPNKFPLDYVAYKLKKSHINEIKEDDLLSIADLIKQINSYGWKLSFNEEGVPLVKVTPESLEDLDYGVRLGLMKQIEVPDSE
jgi:hypothetical protein